MKKETLNPELERLVAKSNSADLKAVDSLLALVERIDNVQRAIGTADPDKDEHAGGLQAYKTFALGLIKEMYMAW